MSTNMSTKKTKPKTNNDNNTCKLCKSAVHTLSKCDSPMVFDLITTVNALLTSSPFNIREHVVLLNNFSVPQLSVVCRSIVGCPANGTKNQLIGYIINDYFTQLIRRTEIQAFHSLNFDQVTTDTIDQAYTELLGWGVDDADAELKSFLLVIMNIYYRRRYRISRDDSSAAVFHEVVEWREEIYEVFEAESYMPKLAISITVFKDLPIEECCVCLEDKQMSLLGCNHSCCSACLSSVAKKRTKVFIVCPLCRANITDVLVDSDSAQNQMSNDFKKIKR